MAYGPSLRSFCYHHGVSYQSVLPSKFSRDYYARAVRLSQLEPLGDFLAREWPGVSTMTMAGFMCNGAPDGDTCSVNGQPFHEIGYFGTTAGPCSIPYAPNDSREQGNDWLKYRTDPRVVGLLGRPACSSRDCWKVSRGGLADQCAIGIVSLFDNIAEMGRSAGRAAPADRSSSWAVALSFAAWSAGVAGATRNFGPYYPQLVSVPESIRWDGLRYLMADAYYSGRVALGRARSHTNPAHTVIRTQHKFACAIESYEDDANDVILAMASMGIDPASSGAAPPVPPVSPSASPLLWVAGALAVASLSVLGYRAYRRGWTPPLVF